MTMAGNPAARRSLARASWLALAVLIGACATAADSHRSAQTERTEPAQAEPIIDAGRSTCAHNSIPFQRSVERPNGLLLSSRPGLRLQRVDGLLVSHPELFHFQRFDASSMAAILSNGCAAEFWWSGKQGPYEVEEIRILGSVDSLDRNFAVLRRPPDPEPSWIPTFNGYRHVMSSRLSPAGASYVGLWHDTDGPPRSLVAAYAGDGEPAIMLGTANWTYDGVYSLVPFHEGMYGFILVDEPNGSDPLYFVTYDWTYPQPPSRRRSRGT